MTAGRPSATNGVPAYVLKSEVLWGMALLVVLLAGFLALYWNRFFPITEGWFQSYTLLMQKGKVPYRDFYVFSPPVYLFIVKLVQAVLGPAFINLRLVGILERLAIAAVLYLWIARLAPPTIAFVATATAVFVASSYHIDCIGTYYSSSMLYSLMAGFLLSLAIDRRTRDPGPGPGRSGTPRRTLLGSGSSNFALFLVAGVFAGLNLMTRQSLGLLLLFYLTVFVVLISIDDLRTPVAFNFTPPLAFVAGWLLVLLGIGTWLVAHGALSAFIKQVFGGASSKGSIATVLFGSLKRTFQPNYLLWFARLALVALPVLVSSRRARPATDGRRQPEPTALAGTSTSTSSGPGRTRRWLQEDSRLWIWLFAGAVGLGVILPYLNAEAFKSFWHALNGYGTKRMFVHLTFYAAIIFFVVYVVRWLRRDRSPMTTQLALIGGFSVVSMYAFGMTYTLEEESVIPAMAFVLAVALKGLSGSGYRTALRYVTFAACAVMIAIACGEKYKSPYDWWGWSEPDVRTATVAAQPKLLHGFRLSPETMDVYGAITDTIVANTDTSDAIFTFPTIPLFYVLANRTPLTLSPFHHFDVCPDAVAEHDALILLANPPAVIVDLEFPERAIRLHEDVFRGGHPLGQRKIIDAIATLVHSYNYRLAGDYVTPAPWFYQLRVWVKPRSQT